MKCIPKCKNLIPEGQICKRWKNFVTNVVDMSKEELIYKADYITADHFLIYNEDLG